MDEKVTWNPTNQRMDNVCWLSGFGDQKIKYNDTLENEGDRFNSL